jgi:hypothetical protein
MNRFSARLWMWAKIGAGSPICLRPTPFVGADYFREQSENITPVEAGFVEPTSLTVEQPGSGDAADPRCRHHVSERAMTPPSTRGSTWRCANQRNTIMASTSARRVADESTEQTEGFHRPNHHQGRLTINFQTSATSSPPEKLADCELHFEVVRSWACERLATSEPLLPFPQCA